MKRVVEIELSARISEYKRGMLEAANATRAVGTEGEKLAQTREAFNTVGRAGLAAGALIAGGVAIAIAKWADFDEAMSHVAATGDDAKASIDGLKDAALEAGARTVFSATESANAIEELAKAGLSATEILGGGLNGSLDLAAAGGLGVAEAAGVAATTLKQFELNGSDASHVADLLAAGAGKAMGDVRDMSGALNQAGLVANQFGLSVEETVGTLSAFASAGLLGSDAGTSFRTMLLRLANPTGEVKDLMKQIGFEAYNAQGQFIGMSALAGELQSSLQGMTQAQKDQTLAMIFGQDAIRGANILLREGAEGIDDWTEKVDDQGYAAETAATRLDNLKGDLEQLSGALETAFISMGAGADGPLRALIQGLTELVSGFSDLPEWAQQSALWIGAIMAAVGLLGGAFLIAIPKVVAFKVAMEELGVSRAAVQGGLRGFLGFLGGPWGLGVLAATALMLSFNKAIEEGVPTQAELKNAATTSKNALDLLRSAGERGSLETTWMGDYREYLSNLPDLLDHAIDAQANWTVALDTSIGQRGAYDSLKRLGETFADLASASLPLATSRFKDLADSQDLTKEQSIQLLNEMPAFRDKLIEIATASGQSADDQTLLALAFGETTSKSDEQASGLEDLQTVAEDTQEDIKALEDAIRNFGSATFDTEQAAINFQQSLADLDGKLVDGAGSLDITTQAGRDTRSAMLDVASSTNDYAASIQAMGGSTEQVQGVLDQGRQKIIETMMSLGMTEDAARSYADQLVATPAFIASQVALNGVDDAEIKLQNLSRNRYANVYATVYQEGTVVPRGSVQYTNANGGMYDYAQSFADGGFPTGIYSGRAGGIHKFAEPEVGWEAYISGKAGQEDRNRGIWVESGRKLGMIGNGNAGGSNIVQLSPQDRRLIESLRPLVNVMVGDQTVASASKRGNANAAWRGGS